MRLCGVMMTYQQMDWLPYSLRQIRRMMDFGTLDVMVIAEGGHSELFPPHSPDGSWDYLNDEVGGDDRFVLVDATKFRGGPYTNVQPVLLNYMTDAIRGEGDEETWVMTLHDDEFFLDDFLRDVKKLAACASANGKLHVMGSQMAFVYNMRTYWQSRTSYLLFRLHPDTRWEPITHVVWQGKRYQHIPWTEFNDDPRYVTFHFTNVKTPERMEMRMRLGLESKSPTVWGWYQDVFLAADLDNLGMAYEANIKHEGGRGFILDRTGPEDRLEMQELKVYDGDYPTVISDHPYLDVRDCRMLGSSKIFCRGNIRPSEAVGDGMFPTGLHGERVLFVVGGGIGNQVQTVPAFELACRAGWDVRVRNVEPYMMEATRALFGDAVEDELGVDYDFQVVTAFGRDRAPKGLALAPGSVAYDVMLSEVENNMAATGLEWVGADMRPGFRLDGCAKSYDFVIHDGYNKVGAIPEGRWEAKSWPGWAELVGMLLEAGHSVASVGSKDEYVPGSDNLTGLPFTETMVVVGGARAVLANDTGTYHLAALLGVPNLAVFTFTDPRKNHDPRFHATTTLLSSGVDCAPCQFRGSGVDFWLANKPECGWKCRELPVGEVFEAATKLLVPRQRFVFGVTTYRRVDFLRQLLSSWERTRMRSVDWLLVVADDGSDDGTLEYLDDLEFDGVEKVVLRHDRVGVHAQTNAILREAVRWGFDFGFKVDDDVELLKAGWDREYEMAARRTGYDHLVRFDEKWNDRFRGGRTSKNVEGSGLRARCEVGEAMGAFWTFTPRIIEVVGYFDEDVFGRCNWGHVDYTWRCCRAGFNVEDMLFDLARAGDYVCLRTDEYRPAMPYDERNDDQEETARKRSTMACTDRLYVGLPVSGCVLVSVVVSSYNQAGTIGACLRSMVRQDVLPMEVVVVDDGSTDDTFGVVCEVAAECPFDVRFLTRRNDGYRLASLNNMGARAARGARLLFTNADILHCRSSVVAHSRCGNGVGGGRFLAIGMDKVEDALRLDVEPSEWVGGGRDNLPYMEGTNPNVDPMGVWGGNFSVDAELFKLVGGYDEMFKGWGGEETDLARRCVEAGGDAGWVSNSVSCHLDHDKQEYHRKALGTRLYLEKWQV